ncbi:YhgE/Pip domain-containing protein [Paenibacillus motobuensis]|uniref:YhgE/Pip family protein n=1 Tax=Paenibacillus TaxID=44249 RepID=UPI00203B8E43|nr:MULTISPECIES: YhgE/Pip domain-containing protein [Paenibacillus]MCM3042870.1 YhgE/Pip domain-containing protein [Paenibacillus lutimineralis]MCM3649974.1 YhgE/Pip domain-containing protein [Paenibacillus motobuensis]
MNSMSVFFKDLASSFKKPKVIIPILVVMFIPVLYSGMFLKAFWDPYGKMDEIPVAVVNEDRGAEYEGTNLQAGNDLVEELKKNAAFGWEFVTREQANEGMKNNDYYMTLVIPSNFSEQATTLMDDQPQPAEIIYEPNEAYNFLAAQIGGTAVKEIKSKVSAKVTEAYTDVLFDQVEKISSGLGDAGEGATEINDGAVKLDEGAQKLKENLAKMVDGSVKLQDGISPLTEGVGSLNKGASDLKTGATSLASGLNQLAAANKQLLNGAEAANEGGNQLKTGLGASLNGANALAQGLKQSEQGSASLVTGLESSAQGSTKVAEGAKAVAQGLEQLTQASPELAANPTVKQLLAASQAVATGSEQVAQGQQQLLKGSKDLHGAQQQLVQGSEQLVQGQEQLAQGAAKLTEGQGQLVGGLKQFGTKLNEAATGGSQLATGAGALSEGAKKIEGGMGQLSSGVATLADGSKQLDEGAGELKDGTSKLSEGSGELASKLNEAADETSSVKKSDALVDMFAQPVDIDEQKMNEVPNYGTGFSPYFLSLGLFVGALISTLVVPLRSSSVSEANGWNRFVSRSLSFTGMSLFQSLFAVVLVLYGLKLEVQNVPMFYLFTFVTSLCFMFIIQALVTWLDNPGRFLAILLLIFQLTTSAGTFPVELLPTWMKAFNPFMPMTFSVKGYKAVISSGEMSVAWGQMGILIGVAVVFLVLTLVYFLAHRNVAEEVSAEASLQA